jgi:hypothetical protein
MILENHFQSILTGLMILKKHFQSIFYWNQIFFRAITRRVYTCLQFYVTQSTETVYKHLLNKSNLTVSQCTKNVALRHRLPTI